MKRQLSGIHVGLFVAAVLAATGCSGSVVPDGGLDVAVLPDGGMDAVVPYDATPTGCGARACAPGEVCVHSVYISGSATIPPVNGGCPDGSVFGLPGGNCRERSESYNCSPEPFMCGGVSCSLTDGAAGDGCGCGASGSILECSCAGS